MKPSYFYLLLIVVVTVILSGCQPHSVDKIVKDLNAEDYTLHFDKTYPAQGITKTDYGAESALVFADPGDLVCGDPLKQRLQRGSVPVFMNPKIVWPTCPTMVPDNIADRILQVLPLADAGLYSGLEKVKLSNGNVLLAGKEFKAQFASMQPDFMDDSILAGIDAGSYLLLTDPDNRCPDFKRYFYGHGDVPEFAKFKFKPQIKGCMPYKVMMQISERLKAADPSAYSNLNVTLAGKDSSMAIMQ